jgi:CheY-like chemotaxis protein
MVEKSMCAVTLLQSAATRGEVTTSSSLPGSLSARKICKERANMDSKTEKTILLFEEDFESMRDLKEYIEEEFGWQVELTAEKSLLDRLCRERFDLIAVDLMIHPVSLDKNGQEVENVHFEDVSWLRTGLEFLRRLRKGEFSTEAGQGTPPDVPVIIFSAVADYSIEDAKQENFNVEAYVEKPFRLEEMIERVRKLLQE